MQEPQDLGVRCCLLTLLISVLLILTPYTATAIDSDHEWLAYNMYHEARGESVWGKLAVALVTINRVESKRFPNSIPSVVSQKHQFSWYWDGKSDTPTETEIYNQCVTLAKASIYIWKSRVFENFIRQTKLNDVKWYHNDSASPTWVVNLDFVGDLENHKFYRDRI
jgi:N-acetylmuramoyl-L-alanine amidase